MPQLKINQKRLLEIGPKFSWPHLFSLASRSAKSFPRGPLKVICDCGLFFQCVLGKKNEAVFDLTTVRTPPGAVEVVGNVPPEVGESRDRTQTIFLSHRHISKTANNFK